MNHTEACQAAGITYRQLDHWTRKGYLKADWDVAEEWRGSGTKRQWSDGEVRVARRIARLLLAGFTLETSHKIARLLDSSIEPVVPLGDNIALIIFDPGDIGGTVDISVKYRDEQVGAGQV